MKLGRSFGEIDFNQIKSGITKDQIIKLAGNDDKLKSVFTAIFDEVNTNNNNASSEKLDRNELATFFGKLQELAGKDEDGLKLSRRESRGISKEIKHVDGKDILRFLSAIASSNDLQETETITSRNRNAGGDYEEVTYNT